MLGKETGERTGANGITDANLFRPQYVPQVLLQVRGPQRTAESPEHCDMGPVTLSLDKETEAERSSHTGVEQAGTRRSALRPHARPLRLPAAMQNETSSQFWIEGHEQTATEPVGPEALNAT